MSVSDIPYPLFAAIDRQPSKLLTREEEHRLAVRARDGDARARGTLVERNLRLVVNIARGFAARAPQFELHDLVNEGTLGLMRAVDKFDPDSGFKLSTYATWWIKQAVCRAADKDGTVSMPLDVRRVLRAAEHQLADKLGREPTDDEVLDHICPATLARLDLADLAAARAALRCASLDRPVLSHDGSVGTLGTMLSDPNQTDPALIVTEGADLRADVARITSQLADGERRFVQRRFGLDDGEPATLTTAAREMQIDVPAARRLERAVIQKMRDAESVDQAPRESCRPTAAVLDLLQHGRREPSPARLGSTSLRHAPSNRTTNHSPANRRIVQGSIPQLQPTPQFAG